MKDRKIVKQTEERCSNFELLRIVAMLMIISFHIVFHCVCSQLVGGDSDIKLSSTLFNHPIFYKKLFLISEIMIWGAIGNAIFILISGYFMLRKDKIINLSKIAKKILLQLGFANIVLLFSSFIVYKVKGADNFFSLYNINSFNSLSWYAGYYFLVILLAYLFLNKYLLKLSKKNMLNFLVALFAIIQFGWSGSILEGIGEGLKTLATGVFLYSLGGYIRMYNPFKKVRTYALFLVIIVINVFMFISYYNVIQTNIKNFYLSNSNDNYVQIYMTYGNNSILVILLGVCIFEIFKRIKMPQSRIINFLGVGTFMVYLVHDNYFIYSIWGLKDWINTLYYTPWKFLIDLLKWVVVTFIVGIIVYIAYLGVMKLYDSIKWIFIKKVSMIKRKKYLPKVFR